jgi:ELWxxDGT repeat protein
MTRGRSLGILLCLAFGILVPVLAAGQPASLVLDINSIGRGPGSENHHFYDLRRAGDRLYFGGGGSTGEELWVSDSTSAGTEVVRDLCPGSCFTAPELFGALGKLMLWSDFTRLWRSDGTRPGTFALTEPGLRLAPREQDGYFLYATLGRWFYFSACSGYSEEKDCDLWRTDGTVAGTRIFHEAPSDFLWLAVAGGRLYYLATDDQGADLWVTDGTAGGTVLLRRFEGFYDHPKAQVEAGGRLFFVASDGESHQVWTSDGTAAGTRPVTSFPRDRPYAFLDLEWLKPVGNRVYFLADDGTHGVELWRTDGTITGTSRLTDLAIGNPLLDGPSLLADLGGTIVFRAVVADRAPFRLWATRGTPGSTAPLLDFCEGCQILFPPGLVESGGKAFFLVLQDFRIDLWLTDGTSSGTRRVKNLCQSCSLGQLVPWKGGVLFSSPQVKDLWISDGTAAGTRPFTNLMGAQVFPTSSGVAEIGGDVYLLARGEEPGLWVRDSEGKTRPVFVLPAPAPGSNPQDLSESGGRLLFTAEDGQTRGLWSSGGTPESTVPVPGLDWTEASDFTRAAGVVFFQVGNGNQDRDLWRTDGTAQGTVKLAHLPYPSVLVPFQGALYAFSGREVWRSSGTVAGTAKTGDLPPNVSFVYTATPGPNGIYLKVLTTAGRGELWLLDGAPAGAHGFFDADVVGEDLRLTAVGPWMYFTFNLHLWRTDGTLGGTVAVEGLPESNFLKLVSNQGALYFATVRSTYQLWRTDDTTADLIAEFPGQASYGFLFNLTPFNGKVFFNIDDGVHGVELWATDGTPAGTALVGDLMPGPISSFPNGFTVADGRLFFSAGDDLHGIELWQSDGTEAGTHMIQDIAPQADSSNPEQLTPVGDKLFFTADDGITGRELWVLPLNGLSSCKPSPARLCLGNRYAVEAAWRDFQGNRGVGHAAPLTADTGTFWFFDPANVEVVLKVLDGRSLNDHVWVFYGALSNVEYTLTVTDTQTGLSHRYLNPSGQLASVADTKAFGPLGATEESVASASPLALAERKVVPSAATAACAPSSTRLCLNQDRFAVEISWKDFERKTGVGKAVEMTGDTGYFWFFNESNVEVVLKVLDGTAVNGHHWVFYGALSSVEYTVTVTDTQTGEINTYKNPSGRLVSMADTGAF